MRKLTTEKFIKKAKAVHGDKYDYSKVEYVNKRTKVCIVCPIHGEFYQLAGDHMLGHGCRKCGSDKVADVCHYDKITFIEKAKEIHNHKYDYSKVEYVNAQTKVCIICPEHGEFWQTPGSHLYRVGCPKCGGIYHYNTQEWIEEAKKVHKNKYDYSKVAYVNNKTDVCIICPEHGEFWQTPNTHLKGCGCPKCGIERVTELQTLSRQEFIEEANKVHNNRYDYSKIEYINGKTKACIICPKHGEFWQLPNNHIRQEQGCPKCSMSHLENEVMRMLSDNSINYVFQKKFKWMGKLSLDFFLTDYNIAIECQGKQHFIPINYFGGQDSFKSLIERDIKKQQLCKEHNIKVLYLLEKEIITNNITLNNNIYNKNNFCEDIEQLQKKILNQQKLRK